MLGRVGFEQRLVSKTRLGKFPHNTSKFDKNIWQDCWNSLLCSLLHELTCEQMKDCCVYIAISSMHSLVCTKCRDPDGPARHVKIHWYLSYSDPAPSRIILSPPSRNGIYTVEEGTDFVLTCEVDPYSYPRLQTSQLSAFRINATGTIQIGGNC